MQRQKWIKRFLSSYTLRLYSIFAVALLCASASACGRASDQSVSPPKNAEQSNNEIIKALAEQRTRFAETEPSGTEVHMNAYQFKFPGLMVDEIPLASFDGEVLLIVNTASRCGFTPQYQALQAIHREYGDQGFSVIGVPSNDFGGQEPGDAEDIQRFCELNYGVTFPLAAKTSVSGPNAHEFYLWARDRFGADAIPRWNFHKLLIDRSGDIVGAFPSSVEPDSDPVRSEIEGLL